MSDFGACQGIHQFGAGVDMGVDGKCGKRNGCL